jgi:hypothetical protein
MQTPASDSAIGIRDSLFFDARLMLQRGLLPTHGLDGIMRQQGYRQVATELRTLVDLLQAHWQHVEGRVSTTAEELQLAAQLSSALSRDDTLRPTRTRHQAEAALLRTQAFTVVSRAYDQMRRCLRFLARRHLAQLAPSLYRGRGGRKRKLSDFGAVRVGEGPVA